MASSNQTSPGVTFGIFLAMAALGTYLVRSGPLESARPPSLSDTEYQQINEHQIPARLWQDPFRVVNDYLAKHDPDAEAQLRSDPSLPESIKDAVANDKQLRVIGVMISTDPYAEVEERRRRRRYAVVSALGEAGYAPQDAKHINVAVLPPESSGEGSQKGEASYAPQDAKHINEAVLPPEGSEGDSRKLVVPYEWYRTDDRQGRVLVLWLDESAIGDQPFARFASLFHRLLGKVGGNDESARQRIRINIIGPARSSVLRTMADEVDTPESEPLKKIRAEKLAGFHILSATATMPDSEVLYGSGNKTPLQDRLKTASCQDKTGTCITFHRTILSDKFLINSLVGELGRRGIRFPERHVVLISELDTDFGRTLPQVFEQVYCIDRPQCEESLSHFHYLRGIDGVVPGGRDIGRDSAEHSAAGNDLKSSNAGSDIRRPVGTGQFDYLRRLAVEIQQKDQEWRKQDGHGITAIGVLGSDVYDKQLILRALRPRLPGTLFFTTDLDAQLLHPAEYPWTRNLIIASSFDLRLNPKFQKRSLPFRNSYQTAVFYSVLAAVNINQPAELEEYVQRIGFNNPRLYEVGRNGVIALPVLAGNVLTQDASRELHPVPYQRQLWMKWILYLGLMLLAILALQQLRPDSRRLIAWLFGALGTLALLSAVAINLSSGAEEEPFYLLQGVSIWPSVLIRAIALIFALYFLCEALIALNRNSAGLTARYFEIYSDRQTEPMESDAGCSDILTHEPGWWNWLVVLAPFMVVASFLAWQLPGWIEFEDAWLAILGWGVLLGLWLLLISRIFPVRSVNHWVQESSGYSSTTPARKVWSRYLELGLSRQRFTRSLTVVLIFQSFTMVIFILFGMEPSPVRGPISTLVDEAVMILSEFTMLVLLFMVVDAIRLCIAFIRILTSHKLDWSESNLTQISSQLGVRQEDAEAWVKIKLIAERTAVVSRLIYYPFMIIILLIASRISVFDNWGIPQGLAVIVGTTILIAILAALRLRHEAERARKRILAQLQDTLIKAVGPDDGSQRPSEDQVNLLISYIEQEQTGAFKPFLEQPVVRASLLLLGGIGMSVSQYATLLY
jgi:hypothetical protein